MFTCTARTPPLAYGRRVHTHTTANSVTRLSQHLHPPFTHGKVQHGKNRTDLVFLSQFSSFICLPAYSGIQGRTGLIDEVVVWKHTSVHIAPVTPSVSNGEQFLFGK
jgi:hypothetical protein